MEAWFRSLSSAVVYTLVLRSASISKSFFSDQPSVSLQQNPNALL